jgi:hypothetical protein
MNSGPTSIEGYLDHCFETFVQPLFAELQLSLLTKRIDDLGGFYEISGGQLILRLVNDRGLVSLEVAPSSHPQDYWDVELLAGLFETAPRKGVLRLNLEEQTSLLRTRWTTLNELLSGSRYLFTRKTLEALGHQRVAAMFGPDA